MVKYRNEAKHLAPFLPWIVLLLIVYWTKDFIIGLFTNGKPDSAHLTSDTISDGSNTDVGFNAAYYAKQLFDNMRDWEMSHEPVMNLLRQMNGAELVAVYNAFGTPKYFMGQEAAIFGNPTDLIGWLKAELSPADLQEAQHIFETKTTLKF